MTEERVERRLAAILATDMVGYSRLMEAAETGSLARLKSYREIIGSQISMHHGRVFSSAGDSVIS